MMWNKRKYSEIQVFQIQGGAYFRTNLKWLAHKTWMLNSNFKLVARTFSGVLLLWKISRNLVEFKPFKTSLQIYIFQNKNRFS